MQHVELCFVPRGDVDWEEYIDALRALGVEPSEKPTADIVWCKWSRDSEAVDVAVSIHRDFYGRNLNFIEAGFDSELFEGRPLADSARLLADFAAMGKGLWERIEFEEGHLAPEDDGWFLVSEPHGWLESDPVAELYASFLRPEVLRRPDLAGWIQKRRPQAKVTLLPRGGLMVVWDDSPEGVRRFIASF